MGEVYRARDTTLRRRRLEVRICALLFTVVLLPLTALVADIDGRWNGTVSTPSGEFPLSYTFQADGDTFTGSMFDGYGEKAIADGKIDGDTISVPCGDGRNPSPSGEEKSVGVWSRAPVSPWSAHENGPQSSPGVDPEISEARVDWRGGGSCARFDPPDSAGARVGSCQEKWHATTSTCLCRIARIRTSARLSSG